MLCSDHDRMSRAVEAAGVKIENIWELLQAMDARQRAQAATVARLAGGLAVAGALALIVLKWF